VLHGATGSFIAESEEDGVPDLGQAAIAQRLDVFDQLVLIDGDQVVAVHDAALPEPITCAELDRGRVPPDDRGDLGGQDSSTDRVGFRPAEQQHWALGRASALPEQVEEVDAVALELGGAHTGDFGQVPDGPW
jgi:hypothetical protein